MIANVHYLTFGGKFFAYLTPRNSDLLLLNVQKGLACVNFFEKSAPEEPRRSNQRFPRVGGWPLTLPMSSISE